MPRPEDSSVTCPAPSKRVPSQWVLALRVVAMCVDLLVCGSEDWFDPESGTPVSGRDPGLVTMDA
ncbi:hypothetical protein PD653_3458 [Nocardioides sp. PD653]|nr:hypothetical protein PD653B2_4642 [Nocardioides sp. PD653-B2]GAW56028.1 hypothetical protein PD653_3458 [Nocardioides sp. PD653]